MGGALGGGIVGAHMVGRLWESIFGHESLRVTSWEPGHLYFGTGCLTGSTTVPK